MTKQIKGIFIDAKNKTITEHILSFDTVLDNVLDDLYKLLNCSLFEQVNIGAGVMIVDEEGMWKQPLGFEMNASPGYQIHGSAFICSQKGENWADVKYGLDEIKNIVTFY